MTSPPTFGDLYRHLADNLHNKNSDEPFRLVRQFTARHGVDADGLIPILEGYGGYDDDEVLLNVMDRIPKEALLGTPLETPEQYAVRHVLYCRRVDGGLVECSADAPDAEPDINRAVALMGAG